MGVFSRFSDIINSNLNSILDKAEDPEKMVRLIIQEMEETLIEVRTSCAKVIADRKTILRRKDWLVKEIADWEQKAEIAVNKGREDLAKAALAEKIKVQEEAEVLDAELAQIEETLDRLSDETMQLQKKLNEAKARQKTLVMRQKASNSQLKIRKTLRSDAINEALAKFERYERKLDRLESEVEAYEVGQQTLADEIDQLGKSEEIDNELANLKERMKNKSTPKEQ